MKKINFSRNVNFWELASFGKVKSLENIYLLNEAFEQNVLIEDNKVFLKKFINHLRMLLIDLFKGIAGSL